MGDVAVMFGHPRKMRHNEKEWSVHEYGLRSRGRTAMNTLFHAN